MTTVTWTGATLAAWRLAVGDHTVRDGLALPVLWIQDEAGGRVAYGTIGRTHLAEGSDDITVTAPDVPVDGYDLFKPGPGWSPLGCICLSRRGRDGNWTIVATDDDCRWCNQHHDWED